uniref:DUF4939 domain-containing protein n=1 Tax=Oreochromis aureus TaxID=47969 RepID=A0A668T2L8_OREAU
AGDQLITGPGLKERRHPPVRRSDIILFMSGAPKLCRRQSPPDSATVSVFPFNSLSLPDMLFECQPTKYATARAKVALLTSLLSGQAQEWAAALYYNKSAACNDYALFVEELKKTFVPPSSEVEVEAMEEYVAEALQQGFIRPSTSPAAAGFFFVKKKDGGFAPA